MSSTTTAPLRRHTRLVPVTGAWVGPTWIDDTVLTHCQRSSEGGFGFRVRSADVASALVASGLAVRDTADSALLVGTDRVADLWSTPVEDVAPPAPAEAPRSLGSCGSAHHVSPVEAVVAGTRERSADPADGREPVALCERCASMLGSAGFFTAA